MVLEYLPNEIQEYILYTFLTSHDIHQFSLINHSCLHIANQNYIWSQLCLRDNDIDSIPPDLLSLLNLLPPSSSSLSSSSSTTTTTLLPPNNNNSNNNSTDINMNHHSNSVENGMDNTSTTTTTTTTTTNDTHHMILSEHERHFRSQFSDKLRSIPISKLIYHVLCAQYWEFEDPVHESCEITEDRISLWRSGIAGRNPTCLCTRPFLIRDHIPLLDNSPTTPFLNDHTTFTAHSSLDHSQQEDHHHHNQAPTTRIQPTTQSQPHNTIKPVRKKRKNFLWRSYFEVRVENASSWLAIGASSNDTPRFDARVLGDNAARASIAYYGAATNPTINLNHEILSGCQVSSFTDGDLVGVHVYSVPDRSHLVRSPAFVARYRDEYMARLDRSHWKVFVSIYLNDTLVCELPLMESVPPVDSNHHHLYPAVCLSRLSHVTILPTTRKTVKESSSQ